jgi:hypothetical protein
MLSCGEHDSVSRGDTDRRRAAHDHVADRGRDRGGILAGEFDFLRRQQALVEQEQSIVLPADGLDLGNRRILGREVNNFSPQRHGRHRGFRARHILMLSAGG